ncbi:MAG: isoprenyl transferase [Crocinitomicaceae bacterium]|nr:isoprenyl transferase [Crocinitomicaceae bacterium]
MSIKDSLNKENIPSHVAIIMDGNGRWAQERGEHRVFGHTSGVESVREALKAATECGVDYLTLYAFSTENWSRPKEEVDALMNLLVETIANEIAELNENNVKFMTIGNIGSMPESVVKAITDGVKSTENNTGTKLILALNYSARWDVANAMKIITQKAIDGEIDPESIDQEFIKQYLSTADFPDPELLIRTSGEMRVSNFLLWEMAYTELLFTEKYWPDFRKEDFFQAVLEYQQRERRFGKVSEQVKAVNE